MSDDDSFNDEVDDAGVQSDDSFNDDVDVDEEGEQEMTRKGSGSTLPAGQTRLAAEVSAARQGDYTILGEEQLRAAMEAVTKDVAGVFHIPAHLASMLLRTHNWNKEKFEAPYFDDCDAFLTKLGLNYMAEDGELGAAKSVVPPADAADMSKSKPGRPSSTVKSSFSSTSASASTAAASSHSAAAAAVSPSDAQHTCPVCFGDYPLSETMSLGCGHRLCTSCWSGYLVTAVNDGKLCIVYRCPGFKCPILVPDKTFEKLTEPDVFARHQNYLLRSYVEDNRLLRWCPGQRCNLAIRALSSTLLAVKCSCGHSSCFQCGEESHAPVTCKQLAEWNDKCKNESETAHWIIANTKKCPKCGVRIEKSQGCNHMTCRGCRYEFCWQCDGDWAQHGNHTGGYYKCNKYDPKAAVANANAAAGSAATSAEEAKAELNRYLFYYQRYHNHDQSKKFAQRQHLQTEKRMATLHAKSGGDAAWVEFSFLAAATQQVLECRNVLKYTYVFGYYLKEGAEKTLFEYLQQQLEAATEHLSELSELPPIDKLDRTAIVNYTRITEQFCTNLIKGVENGLVQQ